MAFGMYKGNMEEDPGKLKYRLKGEFANEGHARAAQKKLAAEGKRAKVVKMQGEECPWHLYVMAKHEFWKRNFIWDRRK